MAEVRAGDPAKDDPSDFEPVAGTPGSQPPPTARGMTLLAVAFAAGIALARQQNTPSVWPWLYGSGACALAAAIIHLLRRDERLCAALLASTMFLMGAGWFNLKHHGVHPNDLSALIGNEATLVRLEGVATRGPDTRARTAGTMARFDYRPPATYFPMDVDRLIPRVGQPIDVTGAVLVRVDQPLLPFRAGDRVQVAGFLLRPAMPRNPGEFDYREYAKALGQAGILTARGRDAVTTTPAPRTAFASACFDWRDQMRRRASGWLLANLPESDRSDRDSMLASLLLGDREAEIDGFYESFQRVGLAHILAISGFHLAVLAGFVMMLSRLAGLSRRTTGLVIIAIVLLYLLVVEVRMPVLRAALMTIAGSLGLAFARRLGAGGLIALSAVVLLLWRPHELFNPGFQLTYATVLALVHLAPALRSRWFGRPNLEAATSAVMLGQWLRTALAASVAAWLVATPIVAHHFGRVALLGIPLSVIAVPLSALILALGYVKIVLSAILPSAAMLLSIPLTVGADVLLSIVRAADAIPFSSVAVPYPTALWTCVALAWACCWSLARRPWRPWAARLMHAGAACLVVWLMWPAWPMARWFGEPPLLRIDMLAVGDGSCYVLRSAGHTLVFDAGSSTDLDAGRRSIIPAMRRMGVRNIDAIAITHPNLDHYSAVLELIREFTTTEVMVTPQFLAAAEADAHSPMAFLLAGLADERVRVTTLDAGDRRALGDCSIECLHPSSTDVFDRHNDSSLVLRVMASDRVALMCGDVQERGLLAVMKRESPARLKADVLELPHHGSYNEVALSFVAQAGASIVLQSTGWSRWQRDQWKRHLDPENRLVTVRDGAASVMIAHDGAITVQRFIPPDRQAGGAEVE
jgi:competence protein ComEC